MTSSSNCGENNGPPPIGLVVPIVIWGKKPPQNKMTVARIMCDCQTVVTGSESGHVVVWRLEVDAVSPHLLFLGHSSAITAISPTSMSPNSHRFISTNEDGQICLWDWLDGRCIDNSQGIYVHRTMTPYSYRPSPHSLHTRLICSGDYSDFVVLDPQDLNVLFTISSRVEPDWISAFSIVKRSTKPEQCIGLTTAGMIKIWSLIDLDKKDHANPLYEEESKRLEIRDVKAVSFSPLNEKLLLVISSNMWQIIDLNDLSTVICHETSVPALGGQVLEIDKVAVTFLDSTIRIYQLPIQVLTGPQIREKFGLNPQNYLQIAHPFEIAVLEGSVLDELVWTNAVCFDMAPQKEDSSAWQTVRASAKGELLIWQIPKFGKTVVERITSPSQLPLKYKGTFSESLESVWTSLHEDNESPLPVLDSGDVTTSLYVGSQGKLVVGRANGTIVMTYACDSLSRQLLNVPNERPVAKVLHGHSGAVRALIYPHEHSSRFDMQILLSGSDDFSVIVWNINTAVRLFRFNVHGGAVTKFLVPPSNTAKQTQKCICAVGEDNTVALLNIRDMKCSLLASRHPHKVVEVKWRPLDDYMLVRLEDNSVYIWQIETANIDRIVNGLQAEDILAACDEQIGISEGSDEAGANQAVQFMRALKHRNIDAVKRVGTNSISGTPSGSATSSGSQSTITPLGIQPLPGCDTGAHVVMFEIAALIHGLTSVDLVEDISSDPRSLSQLMSKGTDNQDTSAAVAGLSRRLTWQFESNLYLDVARLLLSVIHAWDLDNDLDSICIKKLGLMKPKYQLFFGNLSRQGHMAVVLPTRVKRSFETFAKEVRWQASHSLTTIHLLSVIATANTLMSMRNSSLQLNRRKSVAHTLKRTGSRESINSDRQQLKQGWSLLAALHCVLLPDHVKPKASYAAPRIELLARRWQDGCLEIREAAQALLIRELNRLGNTGRKRLIESWAPFLPTLLDPSLSIFGSRAPSHTHAPTSMVVHTTNAPPPIPPRSSKQPLPQPQMTVPEPNSGEDGDNGVQQVRRNQATSIILLGVVGAEFGEELTKAELTRATAISLLELLVSPPSSLLPVHSPLRRAAIDLLGRGFVQWEPHLEISKVLLGLLDLAANIDRHSMSPGVCGQLSPIADACRTARHALSLIANARPPALLTALSMEVARYNSAAQHQTIQHTVVSPLLKSRTEVLRIIEELSEKKYGDIVEMMLPVGDVLVHCLDTSLLKHKTLAEVFPPITKFYMVAYCASTRRIAFGGRNGTCIVHELRSAKAQNLQAHSGPVSAVAFSEDGKYLATYGAQDAKINFWQTSQTFLGMGQSQIRCVRTQSAPSLPTVVSPGGQSFRPRLVWINAKSLTLMLPEGREQRFTV